ncbi:MAG TPA: hypothetical protein VF733_03490 [Candidatus Saccharimonadales bacterium]
MPASISPEIAEYWKDTPVFAQEVGRALEERERDMAAIFDSVDDWGTYVKDNGLLGGLYVHGDNPYSPKFSSMQVLRERFPGQVAIRPPHDQYGKTGIYTAPQLASGAAVLVGQVVKRSQLEMTRVYNEETYEGDAHPYEEFHDFTSSGIMFCPDEPNFGAHVETLVPEGYTLDGSGDRGLIAKRVFMRSIIQNAAGQIEAGTRIIDPKRDYLPPMHRRLAYEQYVAAEIQPMTTQHLQALGRLTAAVRVNYLFPEH